MAHRLSDLYSSPGSAQGQRHVFPEPQFPHLESGNNSTLPYGAIVKTPRKGIRERTLQSEKVSVNIIYESPILPPMPSTQPWAKETASHCVHSDIHTGLSGVCVYVLCAFICLVIHSFILIIYHVLPVTGLSYFHFLPVAGTATTINICGTDEFVLRNHFTVQKSAVL